MLTRHRRRPAVSLEAGARPGAPRCPACDRPLFAWIETAGWGTREDQVIDRCENCGLVVARDAVPSPEAAVERLLGGAARTWEVIRIRTANASSLQAWLGAENWAALRPGEAGLELTPKAARLLFGRERVEVRRIRHLAAPGIASMWQTLLNLLTFHRDFATEAASGRLRLGTGRGRGAFAIDALITLLAAVPTALVAVALEGGAILARRGGVIEIAAYRPGPA